MLRERRETLRLADYDYARAGVYFVTFNIKDGREALSTIHNGVVQLNDLGRIVEDSWLWLQQHYHYVRIDESVVMPDHFHGIIKIKGEMGVHATEEERFRKPLGQLVGALKTTSARRMNELRETPGQQVWQHGFHDRILRGPEAIRAVRRYIRMNPQVCWDKHRYGEVTDETPDVEPVDPEA